MTAFPLWYTDVSHPEPASQSAPGLWDELKSLLDVQFYRPLRANGVVCKEMNDRSGRHFMLKNGSTRSYARISPEEFWIWEKLDGETTVRQLTLAYFMQFKSFAFSAIVSLLDRLRGANMLDNPPGHLYADAAASLQQQTPLHRFTWFARAIFTSEFSLKNLNAHLGHIHRYGGWLLFTLPAQVLFILVSVIGLALFAVLARDPQYNLLNLHTLMQLGALAYIPLIIHEFGHAITAKHFGCDVFKGGGMLYYGMPAAFVDTTDVWMFGKRARLAVTWAGPYTGYIIGGSCAIAVYFLPNISHGTATLLLQIALAGIFTATFNILPLIKLDGYYLLADALEIPRLRERSMEFITHGLKAKLGGREKWTNEEKIFLVFGILAFISTFYFVYAGVAFWDRQATSRVSELLKTHNNISALFANAGMLFLAAASIIYGLTMLAWNAKQVAGWLRRKGYLSTRLRAAAIIALAAIALASLPRVLLPTLAVWFIAAAGAAAFMLAAWQAFSAFRDMRGSSHAWMWSAFMPCALAGAGGIALNPYPGLAHWEFIVQAAGVILSLIFFIFAGRLFFGVRGGWRSFSLWLLALGTVAWMALLIAKFYPDIRSLTAPQLLFCTDAPHATPVVRSIIHLLSPIRPYAASLPANAFAAMLFLGGMIHWGLRPPLQLQQAGDGKSAESGNGKILFAFNEIRRAILAEVELGFGKKMRVWQEGNRNGLYIESTDATPAAAPDGMTPDDYGGALALELDRLLYGVEHAAGRRFAWRALAYGYDGLDWELQEIAEDYLLKYVPRARGLSIELSGRRNDVEMLLHSVPLFAAMAKKDVGVIAKRFNPRYYERGEEVVRFGEAGNSFYLIRAGKVEVLSGDGQTLNVLGRGDYFGETALLTGAARNATVRARTSLEALELSKKDFDKFVRANVQFDDRARFSFQRLRLLRQIPIFAQFEGSELTALAKKLERLEARQGQNIIAQGEAADGFYIIESGRVCVIIDGHQRATLGDGEYFGEMALLTDKPRAATINVLQPTVLLRLSNRDFKTLVGDFGAARRALERAGSRRNLSNRRLAMQTAIETAKNEPQPI